MIQRPYHGAMTLAMIKYVTYFGQSSKCKGHVGLGTAAVLEQNARVDHAAHDGIMDMRGVLGIHEADWGQEKREIELN